MRDFTEKFKEYSNTELLKIIDTPGDYQSLAVEAAKSILSSRQLTDQDFANAKAELDIQRQEKEAQDKKKKDFENKVKTFGASVLSAVNPIQTKTPDRDKIIKIISVIFAGFFVYKITKRIVERVIEGIKLLPVFPNTSLFTYLSHSNSIYEILTNVHRNRIPGATRIRYH